MEIKRTKNIGITGLKTSRMEVHKRRNLEYLTFPKLTETAVVDHLFTTRLGGVSEGIYATMNLSFTRGDEEKAVLENYRRIGEILGKELDDFVCSDQTHTTNLRVVTKADRGKGITKERDYSDIDGLVTNVPGLILSTFFADCVPLYFIDPVHKAIGLTHSGWRGTVGKIGKKTVELMASEYGSNPADIIAAIGPSICMDCYEVSEDVALEFANKFPVEAGKTEANKEVLINKGNGKYQLDLWGANYRVLVEALIRPENISVSDVCTCCNPDYLFSHRASHGKRGNLGAFMTLRSE